ncbi:MAG TPA: hypothetical protein ENN17_02360 [bacterium]|nr:hypothetical protein [bacterium]
MWENETVVLVISLKKRILGAETKARFSRISSDNAIPPFIKALFHQKVEDYLLAESPFSVHTTPHFEFRPEDLTGIRHRFDEVLRDAAVFPAKEVEDILREALVLRLDYLIKPADTMRRLLFEKRDRVELVQMERVLDPYTKLLPYAERLLSECRRMNHTIVASDEYSRIILDLFHQMMNGESVKVVLHDFSVLTDFLSETKGEEVVRVDGDLLQEFLADRNLWNFRRALDIELKLGKEDFDAVDLELTLKRYLELRAEFAEDAAKGPVNASGKPLVPREEIQVEAESTKETESLPEPEAEVESETEAGQESESWDLEDVIGEEPLMIEDEPAFPVIELEPDMPSATENDVIAPLAERDEAETEPGKTQESPAGKKQPASQMRIIRRDSKGGEEEKPAAPAVKKQKSETEPPVSSGIRELIDDRTEKIFVKKLFDGDQDSYQGLLEKLEEAESWRVAKILIDNELFKRDVDPFSREAIKLVDLVYSRYYPEEGVGGT